MTHIIATVTLLDTGELRVEGGRREGKALSRAKDESAFCYVKELRTRQIVRLTLQDGHWRAEPNPLTSITSTPRVNAT